MKGGRVNGRKKIKTIKSLHGREGNLLMKYIKSILFLAALLFVFVGNSFALDLTLFDGRLHEIKGRVQHTMNIRTHQDFRDISINSNRTMFRIEGLLDIVKQESNTLSMYGLFNYWYDSAASIDGGLKRSIRSEGGGSHGLEAFRQSNEEEEITAFPDWEDYKIGLYMARIFISPPNMPQDISFEFLVIPFTEYDRFPPGGTGAFIGTPYNPYTADILHKRRHDYPDPSLSNTELGFRIRGLTLGTDWALSVFNTRIKTPVVRGARGAASQALWLAGGRNVGDIYEYPFYTSYAATFSRPVDILKSTIRGEIVLNANRPYNYASYKRVDKDVLISALTWDRNNLIPFISERMRYKAIVSSIAWYHYKMIGGNKEDGAYIAWDAGTRDTTWDKISATFSTGFYYDTILPAFSFVYDLNGNTSYLYKLTVAPGDHWRYEVIFQKFNEQGVKEYGDQVILSLRYEF